MFSCFLDVKDPAVTEATSSSNGGTATEDYNPFSDEAKEQAVSQWHYH